MRIYEKNGCVVVDLEGEEVVTTVLNEARNVVVKGERRPTQRTPDSPSALLNGEPSQTISTRNDVDLSGTASE